MNLEELIKELVKEGLYCTDVSYNSETDSLNYTINGFAKSGQGILESDKEGKIHLMTRYNQDDIIESIEDFISVAYDWDKHYCDKNNLLYSVYGVSDNWKSLYKKYGYDISNLRWI